MRKRIQMIVGLCCCLVTVTFAGYLGVKLIKRDVTAPSIVFDEKIIHRSITDDSKRLLEGVTATDNKDGDVTDSVLVEENFTMVEPGVCIANYVAFDKNNNVTKEKRQIIYDDYVSPQFRITKPLTVTTTRAADVLNYITATDALEGDISNRIKLVVLDKDASADVRDCELQVTNKLGDTAILPITVTRIDASRQALQPLSLKLTDYVVYTKQQEKPDYTSYIASASYLNRNYAFDHVTDEEVKKSHDINQTTVLPVAEVEITDNVDYNTPGIYEVNYTYQNEEGYTAITTLKVVVIQ